MESGFELEILDHQKGLLQQTIHFRVTSADSRELLIFERALPIACETYSHPERGAEFYETMGKLNKAGKTLEKEGIPVYSLG